MRRGFWFAAGAAAGVYGMVKARRVAEAFTADGVRDRASAASVGARMFRAEFHQGRSDAEADLRERIEVAADRHRELTSGDRPAIEGYDTERDDA
ncbi:DUF6167 family protein [Nocardioides bizhenqiangii]|uniref:DUF6167 family protein n=1 Tax=Nocardioides bizhenqiangii TaxID=3095076 RepID=A0ABZ0ZWD5_9ACTN|nr:MULTISPECIES: DUF6167 family protein [unclassified Nocardioides]MDZ5622204.1 DUF6167 family protein [Nocardioides sp. HM23]WQQ28618.1 DUF6167 family protein [Nocardioides sp. HM61]